MAAPPPGFTGWRLPTYAADSRVQNVGGFGVSLSLFCPTCGMRFTVDPSAVGKRARCNRCRHEFRIPLVQIPQEPLPIPSFVSAAMEVERGVGVPPPPPNLVARGSHIRDVPEADFADQRSGGPVRKPIQDTPLPRIAETKRNRSTPDPTTVPRPPHNLARATKSESPQGPHRLIPPFFRRNFGNSATIAWVGVVAAASGTLVILACLGLLGWQHVLRAALVLAFGGCLKVGEDFFRIKRLNALYMILIILVAFALVSMVARSATNWTRGVFQLEMEAGTCNGGSLALTRSKGRFLRDTSRSGSVPGRSRQV